jgi:Sap, sulfolipid-1-addressing protein
MGQAIGQSLPLAVGVALSPVPIIAVVLMLTTPRAQTNGPAFVLGWLLGLGVVGAVVLALAGPGGASENGQPATWVSWLKLLLGVLLLLVAVRQFRGRPRGGEEAPLPKWMGAIDRFTPPQALGGGAALAAANPKNLLLAVGAAAAIAQTGIPASQQAVAYAVFAVIGTLGVGAPVGIYFGMGKRSADLLGRLKDWMGQHNAVIMAVLCLVIGAKLVGDAIGGLTA